MDNDIQTYHDTLEGASRSICEELNFEITKALPKAENKLWHGHPVWFLDGNPVVGYSKLKDSVQLLFWSGQSFDEPGLTAEGKFKAANVKFTHTEQINSEDLSRWLQKAQDIQWDYKNIVKKRGQLDRL